ncbi:MAG: helix-turn-helix transcriptional regulator, partial [Eubacteriales bacterium]
MTFTDMLAKQMEDPEFRQEFEALEGEYTIKSALLQARKEQNMTQEQLSKATGIDRADISKLERG